MIFKQLSGIVKVEIDCRRAYSQLIDVSIKFTPTNLNQTLIFPKWTPGSYTIRDHAKNVYSLRLSQGLKPIDLNRILSNKWTYILNSLDPVIINYTVIANEFTVRTNYIESNFASLCLSSLIILVEEHRYLEHIVSINKPETWNNYYPVSNNRFKSKDYDSMVDTPIHMGTFETYKFKVNKFYHYIIINNVSEVEFPSEFLDDIRKICNSCHKLLDVNDSCLNNYNFILHLLEEGYGGLEHDNSSVLQFSWKYLIQKNGYRKLLQLFGHEYFHQWNVRRLRPIEYLNYNYSEEVISDGLWFAEGVTSYFDISLPFISGISSKLELLQDLSEDISIILSTPGRNVQSLSESSKEAWIKLYKSNSTSKNSQISYYRLGSITSFCLDIRLRQVGSSLSSVLRMLWNKYGIDNKGYTRENIFEILSNIDQSISNDLSQWLDVPNSLDIENTISIIGLFLSKQYEEHSYLGIKISNINKLLKIDNVIYDSPAFKAGLILGDELLAINNVRVYNKKDMELLIKDKKNYSITYARLGKIYHVSLKTTDNIITKWKLKESNEVDIKTKDLRNSWYKFT